MTSIKTDLLVLVTLVVSLHVTSATDRVTANISLRPVRVGGSNCARHGQTCGTALTINGTNGLLCHPRAFSDTQQRALARLVLAEMGEPSNTKLYKLFKREGTGGYEYGWDYFTEPDGIPAYWSLAGCDPATDLEDYADCAQTTTLTNCSNYYYQPRYFAMRKV